jgi:hypothetical protein
LWALSTADASQAILATGSIGEPRSTHWTDQALLWQSGLYLALPFTTHVMERKLDTKLIDRPMYLGLNSNYLGGPKGDSTLSDYDLIQPLVKLGWFVV